MLVAGPFCLFGPVMTHSIRSGVTIQTTPTSRAGSYGGWKKAVNIAFPRPRAGKVPHSDIIEHHARDFDPANATR